LRQVSQAFAEAVGRSCSAFSTDRRIRSEDIALSPALRHSKSIALLLLHCFASFSHAYTALTGTSGAVAEGKKLSRTSAEKSGSESTTARRISAAVNTSQNECDRV
jgi:hypothetical protein